MRTAIVTDSNSGIFEEEGRRLGVQIVPMPVMIDGETYYEGINLTHEEFNQLLSEGKDVSSSQPSLDSVMAVWDRVLAEEYDEIVYIPMSGGLSGFCQTAAALAAEYGGKVFVVDNRRISVTQRHFVQDALMLAGKGYDAGKIKNILEQAAYESIIFVGVETLEYLKKGGRFVSEPRAVLSAEKKIRSRWRWCVKPSKGRRSTMLP